MGNTTLSIPADVDQWLAETIDKGSKRATAIKKLIKDAIKLQLEPAALPEGDKVALPLYLSTRDESEFKRSQEASVIEVKSFADYLARMSLAAVDFHSNSSNASEDKELKHYDLYDEQREYLGICQKAYKQGVVALAEGGTGLGKALCLALHANRVAKNSGGRVVIAVPTLQLMKQQVKEFEHLAAPLVIAGLSGSREFVSSKRLEKILKDKEFKDNDLQTEVYSWIDQQDIEGWRLETLMKSISTPLPWDSITCLSHDLTKKDDKGVAAYRSQFVDADAARVIVCTHAMLAIDAAVRMRTTSEASIPFEKYKESHDMSDILYYEVDNEARYKTELPDSGVLPDYGHLIVDEGHQFDQMVASALTNDLCLNTIKSDLKSAVKQRKNITDSVSAVIGSIDRVKSIGVSNKEIIRSGGLYLGKRGANEQAEPLIGEALTILAELKKQMVKLLPKLEKKSDLAISVADAIKVISNTVSQTDKQYSVSLMYSPVKSYPRLVLNTKSPDRVLDYIFRRSHHSVVASATLYLPREKAGLILDDASYTAKKLAIPKDRIMTCAPIIPSWLKSPVTVVLPPEYTKDGKGCLEPPTGDSSASERSDWLFEVAEEMISEIEKRPAGGSVALMTSYADIPVLKQSIELLNGDEIAKIFAVENPREFDAACSKYLECVHQGHKALLIGGFKAWTGLNLTLSRYGVESGKDNAIINLFTPRLPIGMVKNGAHRMRLYGMKDSKQTFFFQREISESVLMFKQGGGRLVRGKNSMDKRWYVLDSRLFNPKYKRFAAAFRPVLKNYTSIDFVDR